MQHLKQSDHSESRRMFAKWMKNNTKIVQEIWFSYEVHFYLIVIVNVKNAYNWVSEKHNLNCKKT